MRIYELVTADNSWILDILQSKEDRYPCNVHYFQFCKRVDIAKIPNPLPMEVIGPGTPVDFNLPLYGPLIVNKRCKLILQELLVPEAMQEIPVAIKGAEDEWYGINLLESVDCIDFNLSKAEYYDANHSRAGELRSLDRMILDPEKAEGHDLFRVAGWRVAVIASERLMKTFEKAKITGLEYWLAMYK